MPATASEGSVVRAIQGDPDGLEPYLVYADWLQGRAIRGAS